MSGEEPSCHRQEVGVKGSGEISRSPEGGGGPHLSAFPATAQTCSGRNSSMNSGTFLKNVAKTNVNQRVPN